VQKWCDLLTESLIPQSISHLKISLETCDKAPLVNWVVTSISTRFQRSYPRVIGAIRSTYEETFAKSHSNFEMQEKSVWRYIYIYIL